jgi:hypothetical protein
VAVLRKIIEKTVNLEKKEVVVPKKENLALIENSKFINIYIKSLHFIENKIELNKTI